MGFTVSLIQFRLSQALAFVYEHIKILTNKFYKLKLIWSVRYWHIKSHNVSWKQLFYFADNTTRAGSIF